MRKGKEIIISEIDENGQAFMEFYCEMKKDFLWHLFFGRRKTDN